MPQSRFIGSRLGVRCVMNPKKDSLPPVLAVSFNRSHGMFGSEAVAIVRDGESSFYQGHESGGQPEIGVWRHATALVMFELVVRLEASHYQTVPKQDAMEPGETSMTIGVRRAGESAPIRRGFPLWQPELAQVKSHLVAIIAELRKYPSRVLRGDARWQGRGGPS
jgi:hypothetical protein